MSRCVWIALVVPLFGTACSSDAPTVTSPGSQVAVVSTFPAEASPNASSTSPSSTAPTTTTSTTAEPAVASANDFFLAFDGVDDRVLIPWDESFPTEVLTAAAWIRLPDLPAGRSAIIARGEDDDSYNLSWQLFAANDGNLQVMLEASNENNYCYPNNNCVPQGECSSDDMFVADGEWHHVAVTRDAGGTLVFYLDGDERARCEETGVPSSDNQQFLSIGATHGIIGPPPGGVEPPIWFFDGDIDDAAMWNVSLSAGEVEALVEAGVERSSPGLVGYWTFDEGVGQDVADQSPGQNDGFLGAQATTDSADPVWTR